MKVLKNFHLYLIGAVAIATAFIFNSYSLHAETGTANVYYNEVVDSIELVNDYGHGTGAINVDPSTGKGIYNNIEGYKTYRYYTHFDVTITTDNEYATGSTTIFGQRVTFSGRYTFVSVKGRTDTYTIDEDKSVSPPSSSELSLRSNAYSVTYTYELPSSTAEKIIYKNVPGTIDFKYSTDLVNWGSPFGVSHKDGYYKIGTFNFVGANNDQSIYQGIFRLELPIANIENIPLPEFYGMLDDEAHTHSLLNINYYWVSYGRFNTVIYFVLNDTYTLIPWSSPETILIKYPVDTGWSYDVPLKFQYLPYDDEQYIPLYEFIQNEGKNDTNIETENKNDELSNKLDELNTFEQQQTNQFSNALNDIDMNFDISSEIPSFTNTLSYFKNVNELIFEQIPIVKYILLIILIVLLWGLLT